MAEHIGGGDPFTFPGALARASMYGVTGYPTVQIDGNRQSIGGGDGCNSRYNAYLNMYNARMNETGSVSPVSAGGYLSLNGNLGALQATYQLLDSTALGSLQATFFVYEDDITWCCGYGGVDQWGEIARVIQSQPVTLTNVGDTATVMGEFTIDPSWNPDNLHAVAVLQQTAGNKAIVQSARLSRVVDFALTLPNRVASVPNGAGVAWFHGTVQNTSQASDVLTLSVDQAFGWPADFQIEGDANWYTSHSLTVAPGESRGIAVRVLTDANKRIGSGTFSVRSANSGRAQPTALRVFNGSYSVLLVDNDNGETWGAGGPRCEAPFVNALDNLGYLYDNWDVLGGQAGATPNASYMFGFDAVIWETGYYTNSPLSLGDIANLEQYLDNGGHLFLDSMDLLSMAGIPTEFTTDYLGVASWTNNSKAHTVSGVSQDPITNGMVLPLTWFSGDQPNRVDTVNPVAGAAAILYSETNHPNALRYERDNFRVVFSTIIQNAVSQTDAPPNNSQTLIARILDWVIPQLVNDAVPAAPLADPVQALTARPNPFPARSELCFTVSPQAAGAPVRLTVIDAGGRLVRTLLQSRLPAGAHRVIWDGTTDGGKAAEAGIYLVRMESPGGVATRKLVRIR